jgi:phosphoribosylformylglycinamidine synthase
MAFASCVGLEITLDALAGEPLPVLFNEEAGALLQVRSGDVAMVRREFGARGLGGVLHDLGAPTAGEHIEITRAGGVLFAGERSALRALWSETTHAMQRLRDHTESADEEHASRIDPGEPGIQPVVTFDATEDIAAPFLLKATRPRLAVLREQGVNGQIEMAAAFDRVGFECVDVHMSDLIEGRTGLGDFVGLAACGGFSYGDVLGGGQGWAKSILFHARVREQFRAFFERRDTFALGVCNGCQLMSGLRELIPGAEHWPRFVQNRSERFEARLALVEIQDGPSVLLRGMARSRLPIAVAHGEGRAEAWPGQSLRTLEGAGLVAARYVDHWGDVTERYPYNPSGTPAGINALTTASGRVTIIMPHPERVFRSVQLSHHPREWGENSPWARVFQNARAFVG